MKTDAVVIGAGVAGLACARDLAGAGLDVVVLEGRDRIGGRIRTARVAGEAPVELGAQVVHGGSAPAARVSRAGGLRIAPLDRDGQVVFNVDGNNLGARDLAARGGIAPWALERALDDVHEDVPLAEALQARCAGPLDLAIAREWLTHRWGGDPERLSASGIAAARRSSARTGEFVLLDGYDRLPHLLAGGLDVRLACPVERIGWTRGSVEVVAVGERFTARAAVVTVPPSIIAAGRLAFEPPLADARIDAARAADLGDALVVCALLNQPAPWSGWALVVGEHGSLWQLRAGSRVAKGSFRGRAAAAARREGISAPFLQRLLAPVAPSADDGPVSPLHVADWGGDPFTLGAYSFPRQGLLETPQAWAAPLAATVFFAGEATAGQRRRGLVDGAIQSGRRAARELLQTTG